MRKNKIRVFALALLCFLALPVAAEVKDPIYDELEGLNLVEALVRDQKFVQAEQELKKLSPSHRYWIANGNLSFAKDDFQSALKYYQKADKSADRALGIARSYSNLKKYSECAVSFKESGPLWLDSEADVILRSSCEFQIQNFNEAWRGLYQGQKKFNSFSLHREQVALLLELNLINEALKLSMKSALNRSASELLALAELFHNKNSIEESLLIVELARVRFPFDVEVNLSFAQLYFRKGQLHATVEAFERASRTEHKYSYHVAEMRRQLGQTEQALLANQLIPNGKERLKSRMALYVDAGNYPMIASMESVLSRSELRDDDEIRYALAYSLVQQGALERTLTHLNRIRKPELLEKTALLKKAVLECRDSKGSCRL